ncbi:Nuclear distribution protein [Pestalotiopsis fici W106-1]|uniref:Nuclear distribution protein n=1 Tax=Pestalotiopsis fici (strain W106-1 / CGMCC3.15140) TaxID=1229662 RepID=W3WS24_PESFW|nr:Nuclear distribution protein [Pestalotiopsis fici W106-1]ETS76655.1 Nuclear distribution protein [Pestalotiopsis fici W106-1]
MAEPPSSPPNPNATTEESLTWYKNQYEQLAVELAEFRESSHELEAELEKDLEAADKRERSLREKAEGARFEAEEWKEKCKKAKTEANGAQNALEKEITTLRDTNRTLQLKLRDIEVANDDFERQARHTTSSLEDLEQKYNQAIERSVMMEEEVKIGEKERENLRIENQRLREELSDLKVEAEILQDKVKKAENRHLSTISTDISIPGSPTFENSPRSTASSPLISTPPDELSLPPPRKLTPGLSDPPSPPVSEASSSLPRPASRLRTPMPSSATKSRLPSAANFSTTPRPRAMTTTSNSTRTSGFRSATQTRTPAPTRTTAPRATSHRIPPSTSLNHIRTLTAQMQRLEARVQNARSKLPAPTTTPPRASPRSVLGSTSVPSTVTIRSRKRGVGSGASAALDETPSQSTGAGRTGKHVPRLSTSGVSRLSFGPLPNRTSNYDPDSSSVSISRPSSRASAASSQFVRPDRPVSRAEIGRPVSRTSMSGTKTPLSLRPRSSLSGSLHGYSQSIGRSEFDEADEIYESRTPSRRGTYSKFTSDASTSSIPMPSTSGIPMPRRQSAASSRRSSVGINTLADLGETY